jgi:hypothetical protein
MNTIAFTRLLRIEWRKSADTRAARWMLFTIALLVAGATVIPLLLPAQFEQVWPAYLAPAALVLALLLPVVSILTLTSEWGQRSVLVTFAQEPRRLRVVAAKVVSGLGLSLLGSAYAFATAAGALALSDALGRQVTWHLTWPMVAGFVTFVLLNSLLGMAFGALLLNTPAAIVLFSSCRQPGRSSRMDGSRRQADGSTPPRPSGMSSSPTGTTTASRSWSRSPSGSSYPSPSVPSEPYAAKSPDPRANPGRPAPSPTATQAARQLLSRGRRRVAPSALRPPPRGTAGSLGAERVTRTEGSGHLRSSARAQLTGLRSCRSGIGKPTLERPLGRVSTDEHLRCCPPVPLGEQQRGVLTSAGRRSRGMRRSARVVVLLPGQAVPGGPVPGVWPGRRAGLVDQPRADSGRMLLHPGSEVV